MKTLHKSNHLYMAEFVCSPRSRHLSGTKAEEITRAIIKPFTQINFKAERIHTKTMDKISCLALGPMHCHRVGTKRRYYDSVQLDTTILLWGFIMEHDTTNVHMSISSLKKHLSKKSCSRCSRRRYKEPFRATHVCSCVVGFANTSRDRRIRAEI